MWGSEGITGIASDPHGATYTRKTDSSPTVCHAGLQPTSLLQNSNNISHKRQCSQ